MVKVLSFLIFLLFTQQICGQTSFFIIKLEGEDSNLVQHISGYKEKLQTAGNISRVHEIDSVASLRTSYFISVLRETHRNANFESMLKAIPQGKLAHKRFFGTPYFFSEPEELIYPENLVYLTSVGIKLKAEIMQQAYFSMLTSKDLDSEIIADKALIYFKQSQGSEFMIKSYQSSPSHNKAIINYGKKNIGTNTKAIVAKTWVSEKKKWRYETVIYNVVLFGE
jgi:hypothetical protein